MKLSNMNQVRVLLIAALAWNVTACGAAEPIDDSTEADETVVAKLQVGESTVIFEQFDDGSIVVLEGAPPGAVRAVTAERINMSPAELFRSLAPDLAVPDALVEHELRAEAAKHSEALDAAEIGALVSAPDSDLAGKNASFVSNFCGFCGADHQGCVAPMGGGYWEYSDTHKFGSFWFPETGDGFNLQYRLNGVIQRTWPLAAGTVWSFSRHYGHNFLGVPLDEVVRLVPSKFEVLHTSAWFVSNDSFISGPGCF